MSLKQSVIVALALTVAPALGCEERSNTTEQKQSSAPPGAGSSESPTAGSNTNPNMPNPTGAPSGVPMGSGAMAVGAGDNPPAADAGVDAAAP